MRLPNAYRGEVLVAERGGVMEAMLAYPDDPEFADIQAYRCRLMGRCPVGWRPPTVEQP